jgi:hypothetical protein
MPDQDFTVDITDQSVNVRLDVSRRSPRTRFYWCIFFIAIIICLFLFLPWKDGGSSLWHNFSSSPVDSGDFTTKLVITLSVLVLTGLTSWRWVVSANPSDESFHCDRSTLTISRVRWLDFHNKDWHTRSYRLADIANIRYQPVGRMGSGKGSSIYGLRFLAGGKTQRVLPGITPRQADKILKALKALGADVPDDPEFSKILEEDIFWHKDSPI